MIKPTSLKEELHRIDETVDLADNMDNSMFVRAMSLAAIKNITKRIRVNWCKDED